MSGHPDLATALGCVAASADAVTPPGCPLEGPDGWARTRNRIQDGRAPHRHPHLRKEVKAMPRPPLEELRRQVEEDGGCEATDGCFVEPDGTCEHGQPSWLLVLGLI